MEQADVIREVERITETYRIELEAAWERRKDCTEVDGYLILVLGRLDHDGFRRACIRFWGETYVNIVIQGSAAAGYLPVCAILEDAAFVRHLDAKESTRGLAESLDAIAHAHPSGFVPVLIGLGGEIFTGDWKCPEA